MYAQHEQGEEHQQIFMSNKQNRPDRIENDATPSMPNQINPAEDAALRPESFQVQAKIELSAVAQFTMQAADEKHAETKAQKILGAAVLNVTRKSNFDVEFCAKVQPICTKFQILEVVPSGGVLPPQTGGLRSAVEAVIGQAVLAEMETRQIPQDGLDCNRDNILAGVGGWESKGNYEMVHQVWKAYLRLYPNQALNDEKEQDQF